MGELFTGRAVAVIKDSKGLSREWETDRFDYTARVVCQDCNNTWMSDIESKHAKPVMTPLIEGNQHVPLSGREAYSLAVFAFKTAVVLDHANRRGGDPYFSRRIRQAFKRSLAIPRTTNMWLCGFNNHRNQRRIQTVYHKGQLTPTYPIQLYVLTISIGALVFQVVSVKHFGTAVLEPPPGYERLAVPFWPSIGRGFIWPNHTNLSSNDEFDTFAFRWRRVYGHLLGPAL
jgi:hypothetical protein